MKDYKKSFIELALSRNVLRFGSFTLKSGRVSPYFFNAGLFCSGRDLGLLGEFYADALHDSGLEFDLLFGPAYKGIPIVTSLAVAYSRTAGTAIRESMAIIEKSQASLSGVLLALDRQEKGNSELSAVQEVERDFNTRVAAIISMNDLMEYMAGIPDLSGHLDDMRGYRDRYGI